ncbi:MAG TPA: methyltransferase domain-containing protein [Methylocella sp.]|nr:methyltransferase domain-containing protein [Methylocella sp.]
MSAIARLPRLGPLAKGILSYAVPQLRTVHSRENQLGTVLAESCYSIFLRQISLLQKAGLHGVPKIVAELGPGSSLGTGFAALIAGAEKYYAFDLINHSNPTHNVTVFDKLVELFRQKTPIPNRGIHSLRFPDLPAYGFPPFLDLELDASFERRISTIRKDISNNAGGFVEMAAPWTCADIIKYGSVDWVFSNSVLEHVDELEACYEAIALWLKPRGIASHLIDFFSHGLTKDWNGHWAVGDAAWSALRGRRPYLLNRMPYSEHLRLAKKSGFEIIFEKRNKRFDGLIASQFSDRFANITDEDARLRMVYVVMRLVKRNEAQGEQAAIDHPFPHEGTHRE